MPEKPGLARKPGYSLSFVMVILARQQLFTENTLTGVFPLFARRQPDHAEERGAAVDGGAGSQPGGRGPVQVGGGARRALDEICREAIRRPFG